MKYLQPYSLFPMATVDSFTQGFVAAGCISVFQDVASPAAPANRKAGIASRLTRGGTALAAGAHAATAIRRGDYSVALIATAAGAAGVLLIENMLRDAAQPQQEEHHE